MIKAMALSTSRLSTETPLFQDLIADIRKGSIKIPQFQRKFVWKEEQAFKLLDSIKNNYPIGSLLVWRTSQKLAVERNIGNFKLPKTDDMIPTDYVLDGQQRITVVYSSLGAEDVSEGFSPGYDLENQIFVSLDENRSALVFPLRYAYNTTNLLDFRTSLLHSTQKHDLQSRLDELVAAFTNYRIPVVTLKDLSISEVCPIFERINSSGTKLSIYDLMVAATWSQNFDLNEQVDGIAETLKSKNFHSIERGTVLKCLAAVQFSSIKQDQILRLRELSREQMTELVGKTTEGLRQAVDLLSTEFGIYTWAFLPYEALLIIMCFVCAAESVRSNAQVTRARQWFWRSSFSERYRVGGENFVSKDLTDVQLFVSGNTKVKAEDFGNPPERDAWERLKFRSSNSISRAYILALAQMGPRNITNGALIDAAQALSTYNKKEFHHIYPKAFLKRNSSIIGERNALANICMLASSENGKISDNDPQKYLPDCISSLTLDAEAVFASNVLPSPSIHSYSSEVPYIQFLSERAGLISNLVIKLCEGNRA